MKPITIYYIVLVIITSLTACAPDLKSRTDYAIETAKSNFPNLGIVNTSNYELVRKLEIKTPNATIQLFQPRQSHGEGQIIVFSNPQNQCYAVPLPPNRNKGYWNFVYDTEPRPKTLKINTFEIQLNKALDTLGLNTSYHGLHVLTELFASVLQARQISRLDTPLFKLIAIQPNLYPDSCIEMNNKTYERLVKPMRTNKHWFNYLYRDDNYRIFLIDFSLSAKEKKKYYHFSLFRMPCVLDVAPLYL